MHESSFEWDLAKEALNLQKHGVNFSIAAKAMRDPFRVIFFDEKHSHNEARYYCLGIVGKKVLTIRFVYRDQKLRILGAGYWRKGVKIYEKENRRRHANWENNNNS